MNRHRRVSLSSLPIRPRRGESPTKGRPPSPSRRGSTTRSAGSHRPRRRPRRARPAPRRGFPTRGARGRRPRRHRRPLLAAAPPPRRRGPRTAAPPRLGPRAAAPPRGGCTSSSTPSTLHRRFYTLRLNLLHAARAASFTPSAQVLAAPPRLLHAAVRLALLKLERLG
ncbi:hypothetical protein GQ55_3G211100 [Panicum hallii var. hallii]|uniref:Uncharacterized protein n=1 Tax=Panicum hallii var. hallii TaxID=1504633 RepID=A0A2T7EBS3_9POAL|nr:hypothetical protein GQ55_3G211100 [Panicum hallii var. hallii]